MTKTAFVTNLLAAEGGYVNDPRDSGGATFFGQNGSARLSSATSFVAIVGAMLTITRTSSAGWLVHSQKP